MATAVEIREKAIKKLGILSVGQTSSSRFSADFDAAYTEIYGFLSAKSLTTWDFDEEIPDEFVFAVVSLVAGSRKNEYRIPNDLFSRIVLDEKGDGTAQNRGALAEIRAVQASNVYKTPTAQYF